MGDNLNELMEGLIGGWHGMSDSRGWWGLPRDGTVKYDKACSDEEENKGIPR